MPSYTFRNDLDQTEVTLTMRIAELDPYKASNPHMTQLLSPTPLADPTRVGIRSKPENGFRDVLREIKKKHIHNEINSY